MLIVINYFKIYQKKNNKAMSVLQISISTAVLVRLTPLSEQTLHM